MRLSDTRINLRISLILRALQRSNLPFLKIFESIMDSMRAHQGIFCLCALFSCDSEFVNARKNRAYALIMQAHTRPIMAAGAAFLLPLFSTARMAL